MTTNYDVELKKVTKEFAGKRGDPPVVAVDDISLQIKDGEFFALLGPSGCGKTTSLRMIAGFEYPTRGEILVRGVPMQGVPPFHRPVNTVFQDYALFPHMTGLQNVMFGLEMAGVKKPEARARAQKALEMVQLPEAGGRKPAALSGGQQQRVALARALVNNPTVLLLDEPLGALDLKLRKEMQSELKQMQENLGITFIYVTHDQEEALTMADRIAVMDSGHVLQIGEPETIYEEPQTRFVADFIGETNFIVGTLKDKRERVGVVELGNGQQAGAILPDVDMSVGATVTVAIRPEKVTIYPTEGIARHSDAGDLTADELYAKLTSMPHNTVFRGRIQKSVYIGTDMRHMVEIADGVALVVRMQNYGKRYDQHYSEGQAVYVQWIQDNARILQD